MSDNRELLDKVAAALIIAMGILFVASFFVVKLNREWHVDALMSRAGKGGPLVAGAAFAFAWTPCIGPTLGAILFAASLSGSAASGRCCWPSIRLDWPSRFCSRSLPSTE